MEVKSHNDRLSYHQIVWLDKLVEFQIDCEVCKVSGKFIFERKIFLTSIKFLSFSNWCKKIIPTNAIDY